MTLVKKFAPPALPLPPQNYDVLSENDRIRTFRLYFNLLDRYLNDLTTILNGGGPGLGIALPHIAASDSGDQVASADDTPTLATWDTLDSGYLWTLNAPGSATAQVAGVYKITFSLQFANTDNAQHDATVWLRNNGTDIANSTTTFTLPARKSAGVPALNCGYSEVVFEVEAGDEIELYWATEKAYNPVGPVDGVYMFSDTAQTVPYARPAIPSAIGSIVWVSAPT
jgi:hypothetical protein